MSEFLKTLQVERRGLYNRLNSLHTRVARLILKPQIPYNKMQIRKARQEIGRVENRLERIRAYYNKDKYKTELKRSQIDQLIEDSEQLKQQVRNILFMYKLGFKQIQELPQEQRLEVLKFLEQVEQKRKEIEILTKKQHKKEVLKDEAFSETNTGTEESNNRSKAQAETSAIIDYPALAELVAKRISARATSSDSE